MTEAKELNEHAKSYRIENDELEMELLVSPEPCNDGMSDNSYTHKVNLHLKLAEWDEFQDLKGCGNYEGIYQLNNIWILESINGETISENNRNAQDRKSTRLNSSHVSISYAVFCLKKKQKKNEQQQTNTE